MKELDLLITKASQRAGLLAVITGVLMTSQDEDTKRTMAVVLDRVFKDYPVGDEIEKIAKDQIQKYLVNEEEDTLFDMLRQILTKK